MQVEKIMGPSGAGGFLLPCSSNPFYGNSSGRLAAACLPLLAPMSTAPGTLVHIAVPSATTKSQAVKTSLLARIC